MQLSSNKMRTVANLGQHLQFVSDSQEVQAIREHLGEDAGNYDAFFVDVQNGDYVELWGDLSQAYWIAVPVELVPCSRCHGTGETEVQS